MKNRRLNITPAEFSKFKQHFKLNLCFYPDCTNKAIKAHSIQENGPLRFVGDLVKSQENQVYFLDDELRHIPKIDAIGSLQEELKKLKHRGIKEASTFSGFCDEHDKLFSEIENRPFINSEKQIFLFSYRAFAYEIHQNKSSFQGVGEINKLSIDYLSKIGEIDILKDVDNLQMKGLEEVLLSFEKLKDNTSEFVKNSLETINKKIKKGLTELDLIRKKELDKMIMTNNFKKKSSVTRSFEGLFPIASSSVFVYLDNETLIPSEDGIAYSVCYSLNVFPDVNTFKTHFIIGTVDENPNIPFQMEKFKNMSTSNFLSFISNIILYKCQNTYLSPRIIEKLSSSALNKLVEVRISRKEFEVDLGVKKTDLNLFDKRFIE